MTHIQYTYTLTHSMIGGVRVLVGDRGARNKDLRYRVEQYSYYCIVM